MNIFDLYNKISNRKTIINAREGEMPNIIAFFETLYLVRRDWKFYEPKDISECRIDVIRKGVEILKKHKNKNRIFVHGLDWELALEMVKEHVNYKNIVFYNNGFAFFYDYDKRVEEEQKLYLNAKNMNINIYKFKRVKSITSAVYGHGNSEMLFNKFSNKTGGKKKQDEIYYFDKILRREAIEGIYYLWGLLDITMEEACIVRHIIINPGFEDFMLDNFNEPLINDLLINRPVGGPFYGYPFPKSRVLKEISEVMDLDEAKKYKMENFDYIWKSKK